MRLRAYRPLRFQVRGTPRAVETLTKDLGIGGLRCVSPEAPAVSTELSLEVVLARGREPLSARGRTAWFRDLPHSEQVELGISFVDLSPHEQKRLGDYLEELLRQPSLHAG
jgi:hypothetical protein